MPEDLMTSQSPRAMGTSASDQAAEPLPSPQTSTALEPEGPASSGETAPSIPAMNPLLMFIFYVCIHLLVSPYWPSAGVYADASSQSVYGSQYHRPLPPIVDTSKSPGTIVSTPMTTARRHTLRDEAKQMFLSGYQAYLDNAFPLDELNPLACSGRGADKTDDNNLNINDVLGDFSLTLVDALDTLATIREPALFRDAIDRVLDVVRFDVDSRVQVFEVNIRVLGALLSAHLYATDPRLNNNTTILTGGEYKGELLTLATDLGHRLMHAFEDTATGIPWPRVNLKKGVMSHERTETCAAGAGSLLLEFGVLSRLTGDPSFEEAAKNALHQLWIRRTELGLVGNTIDIQTGQWQSAMAGVGAGTDSFYEYLLKSYILFGDTEYLEMYESAAATIRQQLLHETGYFYQHVHITEGRLMATWVDSLSAFLPGVQTLAGDLESAIKNHLYFFNIWRKYQAIPERFDFVRQDVNIPNYPLRPEFVESTYFLYRHRHPPLQQTCPKPRLPNTFLKGTTYRPDFDFARQLVGVTPDARDMVYPDPAGYCEKPQLEMEQTTVVFQEPAGKTFYDTEDEAEGEGEGSGMDEETVVGVRKAREYYRQMRGRPAPPLQVHKLKGGENGSGLNSAGTAETGGVYIDRLVGVRLRLVYDSIERGYRANMVEGHAVHPMEPIYVDLTAMQRLNGGDREGGSRDNQGAEADDEDKESVVEVEETNLLVSPALFGTWQPRLTTYDPAVVKYRKVTNRPSSSLTSPSLTTRSGETGQDQGVSFDDIDSQHVMTDHHGAAAADLKGKGDNRSKKSQHLKGRRQDTVSSGTSEMVRILGNTRGCRPYRTQEQSQVQGKMVVVDRGSCLFILKAYYAQAAGASGLVVINSNDQLFQMTGNNDKKETATDQQQGQQQQQKNGGQGGGMVIGESLADDAIDIPVVLIGQQQVGEDE
ncbi:ER degradation-enhancing alpha-mannosidase-like protein 1 [Actinomortierella ambigua]|nr:ER degradation-enhancing alpha-mannosidase-like protein 1 [Actinomortierella ambigua]